MNNVTETVGASFLVVGEDVVRPRGLTTKGVEHTFSLIRSETKEATVLEMTEIEGKQRRKMDEVHTSNLAVARSPNSGYGYRVSLSSFVDSSKNIPPEVGGAAVVNLDDNSPLVDTLWEQVKPIINDCTHNMKPFLERLGVSEDELSPFCREFDNVTDLLDEYNDFYSRAKKSTAKKTTTSDGDDEEEVIEAQDDDCEDD